MAGCSICLEKLKTACCCIPCGHLFCTDCIDEWQKQSTECPECRANIKNIQKIYGFQESQYGNEETAEQKTQPVNRLYLPRPQLQWKWICLITGTIFLTIWMLVFRDTEYSVTELPGAIISYILGTAFDIAHWICGFMFRILLFPFHFVLNIPSYCDSVSDFVTQVFWFIVYLSLVIFIIWHCMNIAKNSKPRKYKRK